MTEPTTEDYRKWFDANMSDDIELYEISRNMLDRLESAERWNTEKTALNESLKAALKTAEATIKAICRAVDCMVNEGVQNDDGVRLRGILLKPLLKDKF